MKLFRVKTMSKDLIGSEHFTCYVSGAGMGGAAELAKSAHKKKARAALLQREGIFVEQVTVIADSEGDCRLVPEFIDGVSLVNA